MAGSNFLDLSASPSIEEISMDIFLIMLPQTEFKALLGADGAQNVLFYY